MSYDLTIRPDERYSRMTAREPLSAFVATLPHVKPNGTNFKLDDPPTRWMEIDLELVSEEGDWIGDEEGADESRINCLRLHIPYGFLRRESFASEYLPTAQAIAKHIGWTLLDEQSGQEWPPA
jgi:hypothetical protein